MMSPVARIVSSPTMAGAKKHFCVTPCSGRAFRYGNAIRISFGEKHKKHLQNNMECATITLILKMLRLGCLVLVCDLRESGMVGSACVQYRAFSQELPPETIVGPDG